MHFRIVAFIFWLVTASIDARQADAQTTAESTTDHAQVIQLLQQHCRECHDSGEAFNVDLMADASSLTTHYDGWMQARERLLDNSMPPEEGTPLDESQRELLISAIEVSTRNAVLQQGERAGPPVFRRMSRHEYSNTIRDLLEIFFDAGHALPQDFAGGEGFNNAAETLIISPVHAEKYVDAAAEALEYAARDSRGRDRLFATKPTEQLSEVEAARENLKRLADRAFRRPVEPSEIDGFVRLYQAARQDGLDYHQASFYAMRGILVSVDFLFILETVPETLDVAEPLSDHELATRLSYFLWASMPDDELRRLADEGKLHEPEVLQQQALRMITERGTHLNDSMVHFVGQWLGTADWGVTKRPDQELYPWIQDHHTAALRNQPVYIMESMLRDNRSLLELIDSDWTYLNAELCGVYKIDSSKIEKKKDFNQHLMRVELPEEYRHRTGLLGCGAVLGTTAYPKRTSPVLRGAWVMDKLLGIKLPPPPPNVPPLNESESVTKAKTVRQRLEEHRLNPACASCHERIDPIGFTLENFDQLGRWRDNDEGGAIDATAQLADGDPIDGLLGLKSYLLANKRQVMRQLSEKMLGYALGRGLRPGDLYTVETILERLEKNDYRSHELVLGIVTSKPFTHKQAPQP